MSEEKRKQIAPAVVLASHGNKNAYRDVYIYYHKNIFFICKMFAGDMTQAMELTADIFIKMFEKLDKLEDHTVFEQWFYSYAINVCRKKCTEAVADGQKLESLAFSATESAKRHDSDAFNHNMLDILKNIFTAMPATAKVMMFYRYLAGIDTDKISFLEKITEAEAEEKLTDAEKWLDSQADRLSAIGVDISMFLEDLENTFYYIAAKSVVFDTVHKTVSEAVGVNVDPLDVPQKSGPQLKEQPKEDVKEEPKKVLFTKSDIILFFVVLAIALGIFSAVNVYYQSKKEENNTTSASVQQQRPVLVWNGAAAPSFESGSGTKEDPYIIATGGQLAYLANLVNDGNSYYAACHYKLGADILLNESDGWQSWGESAPENEWTPIGYKEGEDTFSYFSGSFDGAGHTIYGMYVSQTDEYAGLFGVVRNGHISNLCISESYVSGGSYAGGIAGYFSADATDLAGFEYCSFSGSVKSAGNNAGGITGYFSADGDANTIVITDCCFFGSVTAEIGYAGGICGANEAISGNSKVVNCFNAGKVSAPKNAGGITGNNRCSNGISTVEKCYNAGKISADTNAGALTGILSCVDGAGRASVIGSFMLEGSAPVAAAKAQENERLISMNNSVLSDEQMKNEDSFKDFNFAEIWSFRNGTGYDYPVLKGTVIDSVVEYESETA